jgi:anti-sigma factor RsiW
VLKCRDMAELVTPYLEGSLPVKIRLAARFHLWLCGACRRYVAQIRETIQFLRAGPKPVPSPEDESKIIELLEAAKRDR